MLASREYSHNSKCSVTFQLFLRIVIDTNIKKITISNLIIVSNDVKTNVFVFKENKYFNTFTQGKEKLCIYYRDFPLCKLIKHTDINQKMEQNTKDDIECR